MLIRTAVFPDKRELTHQMFLTTRTTKMPRKTGANTLFLERNWKVKQSIVFVTRTSSRVDMSSLKDARDIALISFGFVDGTVSPICRPSENKSTVYNSHKRIYALKLQLVTTPNGMMANLHGPVGIKAAISVYLLLFYHQIYH